ncbi:MAG: ferredoxin [Bacilli bacterium]|nr:ferredoxin [Bacilli bacterium]
MAKKYTVNKDACIGCGVCTAIADAVFALGEDGLAEAIIDEVPQDLEDAANEALNSCPAQAISEE